jgi:hypothetical protein
MAFTHVPCKSCTFINDKWWFTLIYLLKMMFFLIWFPRATFNNQRALKCVFPGNPGVKNSCLLDHGDSRPKILIYVTWTIPEKNVNCQQWPTAAWYIVTPRKNKMECFDTMIKRTITSVVPWFRTMVSQVLKYDPSWNLRSPTRNTCCLVPLWLNHNVPIHPGQLVIGCLFSLVFVN